MKTIYYGTVAILLLMILMISGCGGSGGGASSPPASGLDARPVNLTCTAFDPAGGLTATVTPAFSGLTFNSPVALLQHPSNDLRWYVVEQSGRILTFVEGDVTSTVLIDIGGNIVSGGETGLLGMAFHPQFGANGEIFLSYTAPGSPLISHVSRVVSLDNGLTADIASEQMLLSVNQPYSNHNGGWIAFGPDNFLYLGLGDGGSGGDPGGNGQNISTLLGAILRIDVDNTDLLRGTPYAIPAGNPFSANLTCAAGCPEIFAWGFRNPWRWSFDQITGELWVGDVGQSAREEIDRVAVGNNYGWNIMEGTACYPPGSLCNTVGLTSPVWDYGRTDGNSVTGGYVYRGASLPSIFGSYIYGDFGSGNIWQLTPDGQGGFVNALLISSGLNIASFGQGRNGEIFVVSYGDGRIYSLAPAGVAAVPARLSDTGYVQAGDATQPVACFIPYEINAPFWSDGAEKSRYFAIPDNTFIDVSNDANWQMPPGSVVMKSFRLNGQPVEMRLLVHHADNQWAGYTYEWDSAQFDFIRVSGGKSSNIGGQVWIFPSESDCMRCHPAAAGRTLGLETAQLNRSTTYPSTGRAANQLDTYDAIGLLTPGLPAPAAQLAALPDPFDPQAPLTDRAKTYLHTNCAQCHRPGGPTPSTMDLRYGTPPAQMAVCDAPVQGTPLGIVNPRLIAAGAPDRSILLQRMQRRDADGMPPLASTVADTQGANLLQQWITDLTTCP